MRVFSLKTRGLRCLRTGTTYLLERITKDSEITSDEYKSEGIKLEITGRQYVRWLNYITKGETRFQFFSDGAAPLTELTFSGAATRRAPRAEGGTSYFGKNLKGDLQSTDDLSGVAQTYISMDGAEFEPYLAQLAFDQERSVNLRYYAVDQVGYASAVKEADFVVDHSPPSTSHHLASNHIEDVLSSQTTISLSSTDRLSGLDSIHYKFDSRSDYQAFSGAGISMSGLEDGQHTLWFYSVDHVDNAEEPVAYDFYLDTIAPIVEASVEGDHHRPASGDAFVSPRSRIALNATDNEIGSESVEYQIGSGAMSRYTSPIGLPLLEGKVKLSWLGTDKLGNASAKRELALRMDLTPPTSSFEFEGPQFAQRTVIWVTNATTLHLSSEDDAAGVQRTEFQIDTEASQRYLGPIAIKTDGRSLLRFWSIDNVNNREKEQALVIINDNTAPETFTAFSVESVATETIEGREVPRYPLYTSVFLGATDDSSGIQSIWFAVDDGEEEEYLQTLLFDQEGHHTMVIRTIDNVGNESTESHEFIIKD